jgi:hypothetical protein
MPGGCELGADLVSAGGEETIASICQSATLDAETTAALTAQTMKDVAPARQIIGNLAGPVETCLELNGRLDWWAEQAADRGE